MTDDDSDISADVRERLAAQGLDPARVVQLIALAVDEDLDGGVDVTTVATVPESQRSVLDLVARGTGVVAGIPVAAAVFSYVCGPDATLRLLVPDGAEVGPGEVLGLSLIHISETTRPY